MANVAEAARSVGFATQFGAFPREPDKLRAASEPRPGS